MSLARNLIRRGFRGGSPREHHWPVSATDAAVAKPLAGARESIVRDRERPLVLAGAWLLSSATLLSGLFAYVFHVAAARLLGPTDYGLVAVLWAVMFTGVVVLFRPLEQTTMRTVADRLSRGEETATVIRSVALIYLGTTAAVGVGVAIAWEPLRDRLFLGDGTFVLALAIGIAAYGVQYVVRGACGGVRWFKGYGMSLLGDGFVRLAVLAPVVVVASRDIAAAACAAAAVGGIILPAVLGRRRLAALVVRHGLGATFHFRSALAFAAPAAAIAAADQILVNGGPVLVMLSGVDDAGKVAGDVFAATMIVRIPVFVFQGFAASMLPNLTLLQAHDASLVRRAIGRTVLMFCGAAVAITAAVAVAGPAAMRIVYGPDYAVGRLPLALLGIGVGGYLATAALSQALLALDRGRTTAIVWCVSAAAFLGLYLVLPGSQLTRIAGGFAAATMLSFAALATILGRRAA
jgi:O-antigen/teichoic acid export membrane protein